MRTLASSIRFIRPSAAQSPMRVRATRRTRARTHARTHARPAPSRVAGRAVHCVCVGVSRACMRCSGSVASCVVASQCHRELRCKRGFFSEFHARDGRTAALVATAVRLSCKKGEKKGLSKKPLQVFLRKNFQI